MPKNNASFIDKDAVLEVIHKTSGTQLNSENCPILHKLDLFKLIEDDKFGTCVLLGGWCISTNATPLKISVFQNFRNICFCHNQIPRPDLYEIKASNSEFNNDGFNIVFPIHKFYRYKIQITDGNATVDYKFNYWNLVKLCNQRQHNIDDNYAKWRKFNLPSKKDLNEQKLTDFAKMPKISIVVPLFNTNKKLLKALIHSIDNQTYNNWELCFSDGGGAESNLKDYINRLSSNNERFKVVSSQKQLNISENTNAAINISTGDYVAFMDHDDVLAPNALFECIKAINEYPDIDFIYTDEDKVDIKGKNYFEPHFKSDFNLDMLRSVNYICHMVVVKKDLLKKVGYLNSDFDGAQDYDFNLRCVEQAKRIYHIPKVLYHWRTHVNSTAQDPNSKMYAFEAGNSAVQAHLDRCGIDGKSELTKWHGIYRTRYNLENCPLLSIVIANKDHIEDLDKCLKSILNNNEYNNIEVIIVENNSTEKKTFDYYKTLKDKRIKVYTWPNKGFNYAAINNYGIKKSSGEYVLLLNNDTEIINKDCITEMLSICQREDVGCVGAKMYYEDGTIQHAGVILGIGGIAAHTFVNEEHNSLGYFGRAVMIQDLSAVTAACMMIKRKVLDEVDYLDEKLAVAFNDIDLCMKIRDKGYLVVFSPYAQLMHYESKSRGYEDTAEKLVRFNNEKLYFQKKWRDNLDKGDPYYNVNLTLNNTNFGLRDSYKTDEDRNNNQT